MNKKTIITNTILFVVILSFISVFKSIFGDENTLVGVAIITATLMLMERDLTIAPLKNLGKIITLNIILGIFSFLAIQNMYLGIVINFIAMFMIGYFLSYKLRRPVYVPFGLLYLFILTTPINISQLPMRILSLIFGAVFIMAVQMIVNKNKLKKLSKKILIQICEQILEKIKSIINNDNVNEYNKSIDELSSNLKKIIYDNRKKEFYISKYGMKISSILLSLERINILLNKYDYNYKYNDLENMSKDIVIDHLNKVYEEIKNIKNNIESEDDIDLVHEKIVCFDDDINLYKIYNILENIEYSVNKLSDSSINDNYKEILDIPDKFKMPLVYLRNFNKDSFRFRYALKIGLAISIGGFIMDYFNLSEGRWILFTMFSVIQPYSENCGIRAGKRMIGTLIGTIVFLLLFTIIKDDALRGIILMFAGYANTYIKEYKNLMICVTISSLGSAAMTGDMNILAMNRIIYVSIGVLGSVLINKYVLPYDNESGNIDLMKMYKNISKEVFDSVRYAKENKCSQGIKNLLLVPSLIDERLDMVNDESMDKSQRNLIRSKKLLYSAIFELHVNMKRYKCVNENELIEEIEEVYNSDINNIEDMKDRLENKFKELYREEDKLIFINLLEVVSIIDKIKKQMKHDKKENLEFI